MKMVWLLPPVLWAIGTALYAPHVESLGLCLMGLAVWAWVENKGGK